MEKKRPDIHLLLMVLLLFSISVGILHGHWNKTHHKKIRRALRTNRL